jgi:hypothetical protein
LASTDIADAPPFIEIDNPLRSPFEEPLSENGAPVAVAPIPGINAFSGSDFSMSGARVAPEADAPIAPGGLAPGYAALPVYGPTDPLAGDGINNNGRPTPDPARFRSLGSQVWSVKWEVLAAFTYYTALNGKKLGEDPVWPHTHKEGWFGKSTGSVGVDKLAHAYSAYVLSELYYYRLKRKTGEAPNIALTAALLGSATMLYTELWDSIEPSAGWSWEDVAMNTGGALFSVLRNSVPGLDKKLDFRVMIVPNSDVFTASGKRHFEQQRHFLALKFSGFKAFENGPLRFLELHAGYYGKDFTLRERAEGVEPKRRIFVGFGINLRELFFKNSRSRIGRAAGEVLDYWQPPYTAVQRHITN